MPLVAIALILGYFIGAIIFIAAVVAGYRIVKKKSITSDPDAIGTLGFSAVLWPAWGPAALVVLLIIGFSYIAIAIAWMVNRLCGRGSS